MIEIRDLHKSFGSQRVLRGLDLTIEPGETMVVLGRSGTGKSVLLKLIIGLMRPDRGRILVDEQNVNTMTYNQLEEMRKRIGMLFQMAALFDSMTVADNVALGLREQRDLQEGEIAAIVSEKLGLVGLAGIEDKKPAELSGGMRKRVGLARAVAMNPDYILYDEPTTGLDPITARQINILIRELQTKLQVTSIVVTHDLHSAYFLGDRVCLLHEGRIYFLGTPEEMQASLDPVVRQFARGEAEGPMTNGLLEPVRRGAAGARGR
ncbi:MAG TPA: ABC transporter ATP-binding protein [Candidatus Eisenbacteria bacterium]|nr:ABC transporter ATP-binding protein [Candidatus Eisenbacteria bacterium]